MEFGFSQEPFLMRSFSRDYLEEGAMDEREAWEFVYYAKYSSGYILGNSLTGDKKIFRASQEVLAPVAWCCTEVLVPPLASLAIDPEPVILLATMQTRGPSS